MTATLLREVFGDKAAAERATKEAQSVIKEADRLAETYIRMANEALKSTLSTQDQPPKRQLSAQG